MGDQVFVLKQGRGPKGIFGSGTIINKPYLGDAGNGKTQWMAVVRFTTLVDPLEELFVPEAVLRSILTDDQMKARASGDPISDEQSSAILKHITGSSPTSVAGKGGDWTPSEVRAILDTYFQMLDLELNSDRAYSKSEFRVSLMEKIDRTDSAINRKFANISTVLSELGFPWVSG